MKPRRLPKSGLDSKLRPQHNTVVFEILCCYKITFLKMSFSGDFWWDIIYIQSTLAERILNGMKTSRLLNEPVAMSPRESPARLSPPIPAKIREDKELEENDNEFYVLENDPVYA